MFDVGETLVDETRVWGLWADWLGVPRLTFFSVLGAVLQRGGHHREVFETFRSGIDLRDEAGRLGVAGKSDLVSLDDLYPDVLPALHEIVDAGLRIGIAGNQPAPAADVLGAIDVRFDLVATSAGWGVEKPDPRFFGRIADELKLSPPEIAYVGDRPDNDVRPAAAAGFVTVFIRRGPWGWILGRDDPAEADVVVETLAGLPARLRAARPDGGSAPASDD